MNLPLGHHAGKLMEMLFHKVQKFDHDAMLWLSRRRKSALTRFFEVFTHSGAGVTWGVVAAILQILCWAGVFVIPDQARFLRAMLCALIAWGVGALIKPRVGRRRPAEAISGFKSLIKAPSCNSFPSSHTSSSFAFSVALLLLGHEWAAGVLIWAGVVAFSRAYLGVHFPSDILGGVALGAACGFAILPINALWSG